MAERSSLERVLILMAALVIVIAGVVIVVYIAQQGQSCSQSQYQKYLHQTFPDATPAPDTNPC